MFCNLAMMTMIECCVVRSFMCPFLLTFILSVIEINVNDYMFGCALSLLSRRLVTILVCTITVVQRLKTANMASFFDTLDKSKTAIILIEFQNDFTTPGMCIRSCLPTVDVSNTRLKGANCMKQ